MVVSGFRRQIQLNYSLLYLYKNVNYLIILLINKSNSLNWKVSVPFEQQPNLFIIYLL